VCLRGIAFITFTTQEGADAALACDGEQLEGHTLKVRKGRGGPGVEGNPWSTGHME